jgi:hypothetical protein
VVEEAKQVILVV